MCILFIAIEQHPDFPLIICANRDEFYNRPTQKAGFWKEAPNLLAGKDLQAGGSWLGVNRSGQFSAITNIRSSRANQSQLRSRGELVVRAIDGTSFLNHEWLVNNKDNYNPFNLTYGSLKKLYCFNSDTSVSQPLNAGFHAISNGKLDDIWPKMAKGKVQLEQYINSPHTFTIENLLTLLKDESKAKIWQLPDTGLSKDKELLLSSIFIHSEGYGTRSSTILLLNKDNEVQFVEASYNSTGERTALNKLIFDLHIN